jgi:peptide deformylase
VAVRKVVYFPDDPLTKVAKPVEAFDVKLRELVADMIETMHHYQGVGLAAPQVGISRRLFVLQEPEGEPMCLVNPTILEPEGSVMGEEGCLSMPRVYAMVPRATRIRVEAHDEHGNPLVFESQDFQARIIQHEYDHLEGILFPERLDILSRQDKLEEWAQVRAQLVDGEEATADDAR